MTRGSRVKIRQNNDKHIICKNLTAPRCKREGEEAIII